MKELIDKIMIEYIIQCGDLYFSRSGMKEVLEKHLQPLQDKEDGIRDRNIIPQECIDKAISDSMKNFTRCIGDKPKKIKKLDRELCQPLQSKELQIIEMILIKQGEVIDTVNTLLSKEE